MDGDGSYTYPTNRRKKCRIFDRNVRTVTHPHTNSPSLEFSGC